PTLSKTKNERVGHPRENQSQNHLGPLRVAHPPPAFTLSDGAPRFVSGFIVRATRPIPVPQAPPPSSNQSRLCQLLVLQLLNTLIFYLHGRVQTVNLIDSQFANSRGIWLENVVADGMESQPKLVLLHELVEEIKKGVTTLSHQHRSKGL
ncbi:MAG: hypothetical protein WB543_09190, partial [Candidatus Acidiferrum sp.]